jgi:signal transduction histidine kinase
MSAERLQILMVEDSSRDHALFANKIAYNLDGDVYFTSSGEDALAKIDFDRDFFDILVVDLNLRGVSGEEVLRKLRNQSEFDRLVIIILTNQADPEAETRLLSMGANDFIEKGCAPELFIARLRSAAKTKLALDRLTQLALDREIFAAGVLHDLKNIGTNLQATCELIEMQMAEDPVKHRHQLLLDVANLKAQVGRMDEYATSIISQVRASTRKLKIETIDLSEVIQWSLSFMRAGQSKSGIELKLPDTFIPLKADEYLLRLVVLNILQNAHRYAREGVSPVVRIEQRQESSSTVITSFTDNGVGISEADLRKVFQPFYRSSTSKKSGFGLGLAMVAKVIKEMNGRVWAENLGTSSGTRINVALPL